MAATETLRTTYTWSKFDLEAAKAGTVVGIPSYEYGVPNLSDSEDIGKKTGRLTDESVIRYTPYSAVINGKKLWVNENGEVIYCDDTTYIGKFLYMCTATLVSTSGSKQPTTRAPSANDGVKDTVALASLEIRDTFAIYALQGLMRHCEDNPIYYDDANILSVCAASYRWAQGMMQAAADARALIKSSDEGVDEGTDDEAPRYEVNVTEGTNTEKLLSNLISAVDDLTTQTKKLREDGLMVSGSTKSDTAIKVEANTKVTEMPNVRIDNADWATSQELSAAKSDIIASMPSCKYTPPTNNESD